MMLGRRVVLSVLALSLTACLCSYQYDDESMTTRTVLDGEPCPRTGVVAHEEGAHETNLVGIERVSKTPLCWYRLDVAREEVKACDDADPAFASLREKARSRLESAPGPSHPGRGFVGCTHDEGPVVVIESDGTCAAVPTTEDWPDDVTSFDARMSVGELLGSDERRDHLVCVYELVIERTKPSCTSNSFWF